MNTHEVATGKLTRMATLAVAAVSLVGTVAMAGNGSQSRTESQSEQQRTVTVRAPRIVQHRSMAAGGMSVTQFSLRREVSFADLNLDTPEGKVALHARIRASARAACDELESANPGLLWIDDVQTCVQNAMLTWMPQVHAAPAALE